MPNFKYYVVSTDTRELLIFYGSKPPDNEPENELEADETAFRERWVPRTWTIVHSCDDEEAAKTKLEEERAKLADQKRGEAKGRK
ncbi:hypothetical protein V1290_006295 [Bradyrhizobium sp. AZCC 1578]|uniref:hypothetical protein n=1 Tax=Bradyrhizobium sp. AZCC 1578 TaxID=3117027 RepID=UPI002FF320CD